VPTLGPFGAGVLAGLAIALPLGAIGVLIVREAVERGPRPAVAAALAVASVDLAYAAVAVLFGARVVDALAGWERAVQLLGAAALALVVLVGVRGLRGPSPGEPAAAAVPSHHVYLRFVGLTAVNPMTAVYFVALSTGLADRLTTPTSRAAFVLGVFLGSLAWQLVLAVVGARVGARLAARWRVRVSLLGYAIVAAYAVHLALG